MPLVKRRISWGETGCHWIMLCAMTSLLPVGCSGSSGPELFEVTGNVTLDGKPVSAAIIVFLPDNSRGTKGPRASAVIDDEGHFNLTSPGGQSGAIPGHHLVTVQCDDIPMSPDPDSQYQKRLAAGIEPCILPSRYASEKTSALTAEVKPKKNVINLELKSK